MPQFEMEFQFVALMKLDQAEAVATKMKRAVPKPYYAQSQVTDQDDSCLILIQVDGLFSDLEYATDWSKAARKDMLATCFEDDTVISDTIPVVRLKEV